MKKRAIIRKLFFGLLATLFCKSLGAQILSLPVNCQDSDLPADCLISYVRPTENTKEQDGFRIKNVRAVVVENTKSQLSVENEILGAPFSLRQSQFKDVQVYLTPGSSLFRGKDGSLSFVKGAVGFELTDAEKGAMLVLSSPYGSVLFDGFIWTHFSDFKVEALTLDTKESRKVKRESRLEVYNLRGSVLLSQRGGLKNLEVNSPVRVKDIFLPELPSGQKNWHGPFDVKQKKNWTGIPQGINLHELFLSGFYLLPAVKRQELLSGQKAYYKHKEAVNAEFYQNVVQEIDKQIARLKYEEAEEKRRLEHQRLEILEMFKKKHQQDLSSVADE